MTENNKKPQKEKTVKPTTPRAKKFTHAKVKKEHKKLTSMDVFHYTHNTEPNTQIKYYRQFSETKIDELMLELLEDMQREEKLNTNFFKEEVNFIRYIQYKILCKFSEIGDSIPDGFDEQVNYMEQLYDLGHLDNLIVDMFDQNEVAKVFDKVEERAGLLNKLSEAMIKEVSKIEKLNNKEAIGTPFNVLAENPNGLVQ